MTTYHPQLPYIYLKALVDAWDMCEEFADDPADSPSFKEALAGAKKFLKEHPEA